MTSSCDIIEHRKLLDLLDYSFKIRGEALTWFKSYLLDRTQIVQIGYSTSEPVRLKYRVPHGSVLGPILYTMYTTPLGNIIRNHGLDFQLFADGTQLYISFKPVIQYLDRPTYLRLTPASRTSQHGWPTTCWNLKMTRQNLSLSPPVKLPADRKSLSLH